MSAPESDVEWEAEVKIRRNGCLYRRTSALGDTATFALDPATNDLYRELEAEETEDAN